ncbi:M15 family metallopeptidase [Candidatus Sumerlaeota bacterium]|nr:M15 family metallopeptidase [Candidatus Sumerlaeota bacterium]
MQQRKNDAPESHPWTVFAAEAEVRVLPGGDTQVLKRLKAGERVSGTLYRDSRTDEEWLVARLDGQHVYLQLCTLMRVHPGFAPVNGNLPIGAEFVNRWWGIPTTYEPNDLVALEAPYIIEDGKEYRLRAEAADAVKRMVDAAAGDEIILRVVSSYRSGEYQRGLFEKACRKDGAAQRYSARPGHSEHQLGTAVDICDLKQEHAFEHSFQDTKEGEWLTANAGRFGFRRSYTDANTEETGYISEPWHWRYWGKDITT